MSQEKFHLYLCKFQIVLKLHLFYQVIKMHILNNISVINEHVLIILFTLNQLIYVLYNAQLLLIDNIYIYFYAFYIYCNGLMLLQFT